MIFNARKWCKNKSLYSNELPAGNGKMQKTEIQFTVESKDLKQW